MATKTKGEYLSTPLGIHRVRRSPYDDTEIFNSVNELVEYCKSGLAYKGQKVSVDLETHTLDFVIKGIKKPKLTLEDLKNGLPYSYTDNTRYVPVLVTDSFELRIEGDYILIYYYYGNQNSEQFTPANIITDYSTDKKINYVSNLNMLKDPLMFSLLELAPIFNIYNNSYSLKTKFKNINTGDPFFDNSTDVATFTQSGSPIETWNFNSSSEPYSIVDSSKSKANQISKIQLFPGPSQSSFLLETDVNNYKILPNRLISSSLPIGEVWIKARNYIIASTTTYY